MSSLKKIVCLANSWKLDERCIAGIDLDTGQWVRPVCDTICPENGKIPRSVRLIAGKEPELLDILEIPLANTGNDFGFECENLSVIAGEWKYLTKAKPNDLIQYCGSFTQILHNSSKYVNPSYLKNLPFEERRTLQLVKSESFDIQSKTNSKGNTEWRGTIQTNKSARLLEAKITDPVFVEKLNTGYQPQNNCLITVSLSLPWKPHDHWEGEAPCWKLIAGVIEL
ncbi:hypothetical protein STA3757_08450 [Stanieria sp. NIES-3757]|nr:hypothetical protein STA3757_08450 [Stanieria sp. NIES-3757]